MDEFCCSCLLLTHLPFATPVCHDTLLGRLQAPQFPQIALALKNDGAFKHDQHTQREERVVPVFAHTHTQQQTRCCC